MAKRDYYDVLGVSKGSSNKEIKQAYRRMAMKHHPDRNQGNQKAEEAFKEVNEAFEVLSDEQKKAAYDRYGHAAVDGQGGGAGGFRTEGNFNDIFGDVFGDIFGGGGRTQDSSYRGADLRYKMELDLEDAVKGIEKNIKVPTQTSCESCKGSGAQYGSSPVSCGVCGGLGQMRMQQGFFTVQQTCSECRGAGTVIKNPCKNCRGQGRVKMEKTIAVKIPAGIDTGDRIRLTGEGEAGAKGGSSGDLYVQVAVREHPIFERDGKNLFCEVPITVFAAALGGEIEIPTLAGRVKLKVPTETQTGKLFRLRGKGVTAIRSSGVGDLMCRVVVETPMKLTSKQKKLFKELQDTFDEDITGAQHFPQRVSFFKKARRFFDNMTH